MNDTRKVNMASCFDVRADGPDWSGASTLTLHGRTPGGQALAVTVTVSAVALGYIGRQVSVALQKHAEAVEEAKRRMAEPLQQCTSGDKP